MQIVHIIVCGSYLRNARVSNDLYTPGFGEPMESVRRMTAQKAATSDMHFSVPFVLASSSPRRRQLLERLGIEFVVEPSDIDELVPEEAAPDEIVRRLARDKAATVAHMRPDSLVLAADTIVVLNGTILGKPVDADDARRMLRSLSGVTHTVYTGIALSHHASGRSIAASEATHVTFAHLTEGEIHSYVAGGSPMDKAGGYGIQDDQGALYVERIDGDYYSVVGLPLHRLYQVLKSDFGDLMRPP